MTPVRGDNGQCRLVFRRFCSQVEKLTALVRAGADCEGGRPPLDFAFVSACHSVGGGQAFVDAGVPHVVAVRRDAQLQDKAACVFAGALYHALFRGRSVANAFENGRQVDPCPQMPGRCPGDAREMQGRCRGDAGELYRKDAPP